uniref:Peroxisomal membrane protein MPV17 n=1 Tax=Chrysotila carterae TaxID=13221 RepID=A0A7S4B4G4_CHRCT|mmetsp:Transcript_8072/g.17629  ORF Transcript_8072/g.17629 Transcript_8072/m.17629 type:complete len:260 (+) Transcript_8072:322-1101(+)
MHLPFCASSLSAAATVISDSYLLCLSAHPIATKAATASTLAWAGDAAAQAVEQNRRPPERRRYDARRALSFSVFGMAYTGCFQHGLFAWYAEVCDGSALVCLLRDSEQAQHIQPLLAAAQKTVINQCGAIPALYYPLFFATTGAIRGETREQTSARARRDFGPLMKRNLAFWLPTQFVQFSAVPLELQVPYVCVAGLAWNFILSARALASEAPSEPPPEGVVVPTALGRPERSRITVQLRAEDLPAAEPESPRSIKKVE